MALEMKAHIQRLHAYNELKDSVIVLLGRLAELEGVTVKSLYERFDIQLDD